MTNRAEFQWEALSDRSPALPVKFYWETPIPERLLQARRGLYLIPRNHSELSQLVERIRNF